MLDFLEKIILLIRKQELIKLTDKNQIRVKRKDNECSEKQILKC